jgi:hypothetical protein
MDEQLLNCIVHWTESKGNFPQILNCGLRHVFQYTCVSSPDAVTSHLFISGIPCALNTYRSFNILFYAVFNRSEQGLPISHGEIEKISVFFYLKSKLSKAIPGLNSSLPRSCHCSHE